MKIICESCSAQYDLDENRIPPSGMTMKCPACLHSFQVRRAGAAPPPIPPPQYPKTLQDHGVELSPEHDDDTPLRVVTHGKSVDDEDLIDLPAPKAARPPQHPVPLSTEEIVDLPGPVGARPHQEVAPSQDVIDLPAPRRKSGSQIPRVVEDEPDLLAPKRAGAAPSVGIDLDAPDADDVASGPAPVEDYGPPPIELDSIDVVAPKHHELPGLKQESQELAPKQHELPVPKRETTDVAPKPDVTDVAPVPDTVDVAPKPGEAPRPIAAEPLPAARKKAAAPDEPSNYVEEAPRKKRRRAPIAVAVVALLVGGVGLGLGFLTSAGFFGANLFGNRQGGAESKLMAARKLLADDTLASYRKAALDLHGVVESQPKSIEAQALEAQARLAQARLGNPAELRAADTILAALDAGGADGQSPDAQKARALKSLAAGKLDDARAKLGAVLAAAPSDASALVYLGWTELSAGDAAAAERAFAKALAAEPSRAAALYGDGVAKERLGDAAAARDLYTRALARSPQHFGAAVGLARVSGAGASGAQSQLEELIAKRSSSAAPRELSDAWSSIGALAAAAGRRDEAEDRLKRALTLDPESSTARVLLARVQCDAGRCKDALAGLRKVTAAEPKNLDARLGLARALVETGAVKDAETTLAPAIAQAPKDARVLYWQGRLLLAREVPDRAAALQKFKDAVAADGKFIPAYLAESSTFALFGKNDDALEVLAQAEAKATNDPDLMLELGQAYLALGKGAQAEARFRGVLALRAEDPSARLQLGAALELEGKLDEARAEYDGVAQKSPDHPGLAERQALLAAKQGRRDEAWALYQKAIAQGVPTQALRLQAADLALSLGKLDDARKLAESVIKEDDRSPLAHLAYARAQLAAHHADEAMIEARRAATISDLPEAHLVLGQSLEALGKIDQALQEYGLAKRPPVEGEASLGRARMLVRLGASRDALAEVQTLFHDKRLRGPALLVAGDCYADQQQVDKARHAYEDAVHADPQLGEAAFKFGRALHDAGRRKPAIAELERALKLGGDDSSYAVEAYLILGDAHREAKESDAAVKAYKRYLELAPSEAPARAEVNHHLSILGGH
ncbi:MAG TPA: tetratricopeptide repeat protein [Polyangia bacterium]|nr:tetratricopeptide repeat protein [Polyangia bacterium]